MHHNFMGLDGKDAAPGSARVVILPVPYDSTVSYRPGARDGSAAIINASKYVELYDDEINADISRLGIHTAQELEPEMGSPQRMVDLVQRTATDILKKDKFLVSLGGEHSISIGLVRAYAEKYENLSVLQLDAHADLRDFYLGTRYGHASTMRRIIETTHAVQVGIRSFSEEDIAVIQKEKLMVVKAEEAIFSNNLIEDAIGELRENVYVTIDLDVFDPSIMPATGTPEPGGLGWYKVLEILKQVSLKKRIVGFDVMELAPIPGNVAPDFMAAKLTYKVIGYSLWKR